MLRCAIKELLQLLLAAPFMASIKDVDLGFGPRGCTDLGQLTTNVIISFFQVLYGTFLKMHKFRKIIPNANVSRVGIFLINSKQQFWELYSVLLVVIAVVDNYEAQVEALAQVKEVVCLSLSPAIVMEMHLIFLL